MSSIAATSETINELKTEIQNKISTTERGLSTTKIQEENIEDLLQKLETKCPLSEPARSSLMGGKWIVDYTTSPSPSNGKLGPFVGYARQIIDLEKGTYVNYLSVPGDIEKEWLSATLEATFSEWDGTFLKDDRVKGEDDVDIVPVDDDLKRNDDNDVSSPNNIFSIFQDLFTLKANVKKSTNVDYGADSWKVEFQTLTIKAFGFQLIKKEFENISRIWKMSYLDEETRIGKFI